MKRFLIFYAISLLSFSHIHSYQVVALEIVKDSPDSALIRWKSSDAESEFSLYHNDKLINDKFALYDSELIITSNFIGVSSGSLYQYEYKVTFHAPGAYYFAVIQNNTQEFDRVARAVMTEAVPQYTMDLIPELNTTTQPIDFSFHVAKPIKVQNPQIKQTVITSLELLSFEDMFQLRWNVYPKDLSNYVFTVYRSRFPIIGYGSPMGLPVYATVTNQFSFEDQNIEFEVPYYYAVVAENTLQWDSGINVFSNPAILLKESPPLHIKPTIEYIKTKRVLSLNTKNDLTEEEMQLAVQQTLSNLHENPDRMYISSNPTMSDSLAMSDLQRSTSTIKTYNKNDQDKAVLNDFINELEKHKNDYIYSEEKAYNRLIANLNRNQEKFINEEYKVFNDIAKSISDLYDDIDRLKPLEYQLLVSDRLSTQDFTKQLSSYYSKVDQLRINQYHIQGAIRNVNRAEQRFISNQYLLKKSFEQEIDQLKQEHQQKLKIQSVARNISLQAENTDSLVDSHFSRFNSAPSPTRNQDMEINLAKIRISKEMEYIDKLLQNNGEQFQQEYLVSNERDIDGYIHEQLVKAQNYYKNITVEEIPDISNISNEKWLSQKDIWVNNNKEIWISKHDIWQQRMSEILGRDYQQVVSKWMTPSQTVALREGKKAFLNKNYKEAVYLLYFVTKDHNALMALGQSYYQLGAYRDAFSVFITALHMGIPESRYWIDKTAEQILKQ